MDRLIYSASNTQMDFDLYLDRGSALTHAKGADGDPDWSAKGRWMVFTSARTGQGDLYLLDLHRAGTPPVRLTSNPESSELDAVFAPHDDQLLYVTHTDQGDNLYLISDLSNPVPEQITRWSRSQVKPSWSPDGQHIAFYSNHDFVDRTDLYVMRLGSAAYPVALGVVKNQNGPSWTPDGQELVYVLDDDDAFDPVYRVPIANPDQARLVPTQTVGNGDLDVVLGTDGKVWLAITAQGRVEDPVRDYKRIYIMTLP